MQIDIITIFPEMFESPFNSSIIKRAMDKKSIDIQIHNLRDYATNKHKNVDDYAFGGQAGMVMMIEPIDRCIQYLQSKRQYDEKIYLSPDGELLNQSIVNQLSTYKNILLLCGHYKGIDERVRDHLITKEISIGNYVLSGGELAAAILTDAVVRIIPGVLSDETSALSDSFQDNLISPPVYTRPREYKGWKVPDILLSGNEKKIKEWQHEQSTKRTIERRPDIYENKPD